MSDTFTENDVVLSDLIKPCLPSVVMSSVP
jgi:hypothetical protein